MIKSHEHYEALKNLAVALNVVNVIGFEEKSIAWLEAASRLALGGAIVLAADGELVPTEDVARAPIWCHDLLLVFEKID